MKRQSRRGSNGWPALSSACSDRQIKRHQQKNQREIAGFFVPSTQPISQTGSGGTASSGWGGRRDTLADNRRDAPADSPPAPESPPLRPPVAAPVWSPDRLRSRQYGWRGHRSRTGPPNAQWSALAAVAVGPVVRPVGGTRCGGGAGHRRKPTPECSQDRPRRVVR